MFEITELSLSGLYLIKPPHHIDFRGSFTKIFHEPSFQALGLDTRFAESFYSISRLNVVRGLHFQVPPFDHNKSVTCLGGEAQDVVVDLRRKSTTYGHHVVVPLTENEPGVLYIPRGMAHGFLSLAPSTVLLYNVTVPFEPSADSGILWDSAEIAWKTETPIISDRDLTFSTLADFESPF